jgi:hypothetical protein
MLLAKTARLQMVMILLGIAGPKKFKLEVYHHVTGILTHRAMHESS